MNDLSGKTVKLSDFRGKGVILIFWSQSNRASQKQITDLGNIQKKYKDLVLIGITKDKDRDSLAKTVAQMKTTSIIVPDGERLLKQYAVRSIPDSYYIDRDGLVKFHVAGSKMGYQTDIERRIKVILEESKVKSQYSR